MVPRIPRHLRELGAVQQLVSFLTGAEEPSKETAETKPAEDPPKAPAPAGVDRMADVKRLRSEMSKIRDYLRGYGTALAALATTVLTGLTWATLHVIFPVPAGQPWVAPGVIAFAGAAGLGSVWLVTRFFAAQRRVLYTPSEVGHPEREAAHEAHDVRQILLTATRPRSGLKPREAQAVRRILDEHAAEQQAASFRALEMRSLRLARIARRPAPDAAGKKLALAAQTESDRITEVMEVAGARATLSLLEDRASNVVGGGRSYLALGMAATGIVGLFLLADYSKGERDLIALRKACAEAVEAGAENACDPVDGPAPTPTTTPTPTPSSVPTADLGVVQRLEECAAELAPDQPNRSVTVPPSLVERAVAACAGLPAPPAPTPSSSTTS